MTTEANQVLSVGSGNVLVDSNLMLGNAAEAGDGGGLVANVDRVLVVLSLSRPAPHPPLIDPVLVAPPHPENEPATSLSRVRPPIAGPLDFEEALPLPASRGPRAHTGQ